ncbi:MAG: archaeal proteasome endopeptidase complex subunit alpha [Candidatus Lokiarchaeota archaeon]|nr:archaeal proteasome endopeptidase complex subunit alpha [Candidatus Lokiarchaeota archaeon]MBD3199326.1 archaeal proteasome endopeptidase complex subunit alpha [Candidatus Lokiarchaeota archaeon]
MFSQQGRGYDMAITQFSPEGRLFQVEYAIEAVRRGTTAICARNENSVVFAVEKKSSELQETIGSEKIFKIDDHIGVTIAGLTADARVLIDKGRVQAQIHVLNYDEKITVKELTLETCEILQAYTQNAGVRPFGVSFLIAGRDPDGKTALFLTDPSGALWGYSAFAIGSGANEARTYLEENYKQDISDEELKLLPLKTLKEVMGEENLDENSCDVAVILKDEEKFRLLSTEEKKELLGKI